MFDISRIRLATAVAYHLPGASLTLKCGVTSLYVGPTTEIRSQAHPGDLRDLVHLFMKNNNENSFYNALGFKEHKEITTDLHSAPGLFMQLGAGLYLATPPTSRSVYSFPTLLSPLEVERIIRTISLDGINATIDFDEALGVTLATFEKRQIDEYEINDDQRLETLAKAKRELGFVDYAPIVTLSALSGRKLDKIIPALFEARDAYEQRIPTGELNKVIHAAQISHPHPMRRNKRVRIFYATQGASNPPTITLFTSQALDESYMRYLENVLRESFDLGSTAIKLRFKRKSG